MDRRNPEAIGELAAQDGLEVYPPGSAMDSISRFFMPNTYGAPARGASSPYTPPLWRDMRNPDDPLSPNYGKDPRFLRRPGGMGPR